MESGKQRSEVTSRNATMTRHGILSTDLELTHEAMLRSQYFIRFMASIERRLHVDVYGTCCMLISYLRVVVVIVRFVIDVECAFLWCMLYMCGRVSTSILI